VPTVELRGARGEPFPITFARDADVAHEWVLDLEHVPQAMTPLAEAVCRVGRVGREQAYAESGVTMPSPLRAEPPYAHGYRYDLAFELEAGERREHSDEVERLSARHGGTAGVWAGHSLPFIRRTCGALAVPLPDRSFAALAAQREHVWGHTGVAGAVSRLAERTVAQACREQFGDHAEQVAHELAQGSINDTLAADVALWRVAHLPVGSAESSAARAVFLEEHGNLAVGWSIDDPTLRERPDLVDVQLQLLRDVAAPDPEVVVREAAQRRAALLAEIERHPPRAVERASLARALDDLTGFVPVRESRARWQLIATGLLRAAVLARGQALVAQGALASIDDVFFLQPEEYDDPAHVSARVIGERRAEHGHWRRVQPPRRIGGARRAGKRGPAAGSDAASAPAGPVVVGVGGSPGVATGRARVILDLADAGRLEPGDVLVATMTSPPWTALFGLAAAVVTDAGDPISHVAIAAREYGIPCVVGTGTATTSVPDGATVTVDGSGGFVHVHGERRS